MYPFDAEEDSLLELTGRSVSDRLQEADDLLSENDPLSYASIYPSSTEQPSFGVWDFWKS